MGEHTSTTTMALSVAGLTAIEQAKGAQYITDLIGEQGTWRTSIRGAF